MKTLVNNYYGTSGQIGTSGGSGGPGAYALNIGGAKTGGGHYLPPGVYAIGASVEVIGSAGGYGGMGITSYNGGNGGGGGAGGMGVLLGGGTLSNGNDVLSFVSDYHRGLTDGRIMPVHGLGSSLLSTASAAASDHTSDGVASHAFVDHGFTHPTFDVCKA